MKLYLVRHGASTGNVPGYLLGHGSHELTAAGEAQARAAAARLAPLAPLPVYCSDLTRARQTAEYIVAAGSGAARSAPAVSPLIAEARLRELHLGDYDGRSWDEYLNDAPLNEAMRVDPLGTRLPGGESAGEMQRRVLAVVGEMVEGDAEAVCCVTHDGPIRAILNHYLGIQPERWWALTTAHGGISMLEWSHGWVNVSFVNDTSHLEGAALPLAGVRRSAAAQVEP